MFSILIPTWNNLPFLKLCLESIQKNSAYPHQVLLHINDGSDGTLQFAKENQLQFTHSETNVGICIAVNKCSAKATSDYIVFMNDDMYLLPGWDTALLEEITKLDTDCFMLSSTMIEPRDTGNKCVIVADYGTTAENFKEEKLSNEFKNLPKNDWSGSTWPPNIVHRKWWLQVGGYSEEFSPGMSSDDDFSMKMWNAGCRVYKGVADSRAYHFISKSTGRVMKNDGRKQFLQKWRMKQSTYHKYYLKRGQPYTGKLSEPSFSLGLMLKKVEARVRLML